MLNHRIHLSALVAVAALAASAAAASAAPCAPAGADPVDAVRRMYAAATAGDRARTIAAFTPDGYLFDGGARFTPEGITDLILKVEASGVSPRWTIEGPDSHTACDLAWATWTNRGTFTSAKGAEPRVWLESAVLVWSDGVWKIRFFQSTPVSPAG